MAENGTQEPNAPDTIVLVHGLWMTPRSWEHWIAHYEGKGYRVLAPLGKGGGGWRFLVARTAHRPLGAPPALMEADLEGRGVASLFGRYSAVRAIERPKE